jgi:uncharacterized membrane-anchored protein
MARLGSVLGLSAALCLSSAVLVQGAPAFAQAAAPAAPAASAASASPDGAQPEGAGAIEEPTQPALPFVEGPKQIALGHGVSLDLPDTHAYLAQPDAGKLMEKMGNLHNEDLIGLVLPNNQNDEYLVTLRYEDSGHIKDDEELDGAELLDSIKEGEQAYNDELKQRGFPPIHIGGWDETPRYDQQKHQLIWALIVEGTDGTAINYNTRILGRTGFVSVNLITDKQHLAQYKPAGATILSRTSFDTGQRYADFDSSKDKVAEYGLTGLVLGGAGLGLAKVAKIGLLAKFGKGLIALLIAGKKAIVAGVIALGALLKKVFAKKSDAPA